MLEVVIPSEQVVELLLDFILHDDHSLIDSGKESKICNIDMSRSVESSSSQMFIQLL